jgi:hypothetical protein
MPSHAGQTRNQPRDEKGRLLPKPPPEPVHFNATATPAGYSGGRTSTLCAECGQPVWSDAPGRCGTCHRELPPEPETSNYPNTTGPF